MLDATVAHLDVQGSTPVFNLLICLCNLSWSQKYTPGKWSESWHSGTVAESAPTRSGRSRLILRDDTRVVSDALLSLRVYCGDPFWIETTSGYRSFQRSLVPVGLLSTLVPFRRNAATHVPRAHKARGHNQTRAHLVVSSPSSLGPSVIRIE